MQPPSGSVQIEHAQGAGARMRSGHRTRTRLEKCGWGFPPSRHAAASAYPQAPPPEEARRWSWWVVYRGDPGALLVTGMQRAWTHRRCRPMVNG